MSSSKAKELIDLLRLRYPREKGWAFIPEIEAPQRGRSDAIAVGLWPSSGHTLINFEIKCSRQDLFSEIDNPAKKEKTWFPYARQNFMVLGSRKLAKDSEIPDEWGVISLTTKGGLRMSRRPKIVTPKKALGLVEMGKILNRVYTTEIDSAFKRGRDYTHSMTVRQDSDVVKENVQLIKENALLKRQAKVIDAVETFLGIQTVDFDKDNFVWPEEMKKFYELWGADKKLSPHSLCRNIDVLKSSLTDDLIEKLEKLKEMVDRFE